MVDRITGFPAPTFDDLLTRSLAAYASRSGSNPQLRNGVIRTMAYVDAMMAAGEHAHIDYLAGQTLALYATGENLDACGRENGVFRKPPARAEGTVTMTGNTGAVIDAGAALAAADGTAYTVTAGATVVGGVAVVAVRASEGGAAGNRVAGEALALVEAAEGVDPQAVVIAISGGADVEEDGAPGVEEHYRGRILEYRRNPPQGGSNTDYAKWVADTPNVPVTRAWVSPKELGRGTVTVRFMVDGATETGIPTPEQVALVQAYVETRDPAPADTYVVAPIGVPLDISISGLNPDTPAVRAAIAAELADLIYRRGFPGCTIYRSWIGAAISNAAGEDHHASVEPSGDIAFGIGEIPIVGEVTYA